MKNTFGDVVKKEKRHRIERITLHVNKLIKFSVLGKTTDSNKNRITDPQSSQKQSSGTIHLFCICDYDDDDDNDDMMMMMAVA